MHSFFKQTMNGRVQIPTCSWKRYRDISDAIPRLGPPGFPAIARQALLSARDKFRRGRTLPRDRDSLHSRVELINAGRKRMMRRE